MAQKKSNTVCPHCEQEASIKRPDGSRTLDAGGTCPTCKRSVCRSCSGGWCG